MKASRDLIPKLSYSRAELNLMIGLEELISASFFKLYLTLYLIYKLKTASRLYPRFLVLGFAPLRIKQAGAF